MFLYEGWKGTGSLGTCYLVVNSQALLVVLFEKFQMVRSLSRRGGESEAKLSTSFSASVSGFADRLRISGILFSTGLLGVICSRDTVSTYPGQWLLISPSLPFLLGLAISFSPGGLGAVAGMAGTSSSLIGVLVSGLVLSGLVLSGVGVVLASPRSASSISRVILGLGGLFALGWPLGSLFFLGVVTGGAVSRFLHTTDLQVQDDWLNSLLRRGGFGILG